MIETDAAKVYNDFLELSQKNMKKSLTSGLRKALNEVKQNAVSNLNALIKNATRRNPKYSDTLQSGVRTTRIWESQDGAIIGKVTIIGNGKSGSGSFRLPILESGSYKVGERFTKTYKGKPLKKKASRGVLQGKFFFKKTQNEMEDYFQNTMNKAIEDAVNKTNEKQ